MELATPPFFVGVSAPPPLCPQIAPYIRTATRTPVEWETALERLGSGGKMVRTSIKPPLLTPVGTVAAIDRVLTIELLLGRLSRSKGVVGNGSESQSVNGIL